MPRSTTITFQTFSCLLVLDLQTRNVAEHCGVELNKYKLIPGGEIGGVLTGIIGAVHLGNNEMLMVQTMCNVYTNTMIQYEECVRAAEEQAATYDNPVDDLDYMIPTLKISYNE
jgi:hypothetical protein